MNRSTTLASLTAVALLASLSLACSDEKPTRGADGAVGLDRPLEGTEWTADGPQPIAGAPSPEAVAAALELLREEQRVKDLEEREAAVAAKEAELAEREASASRAASSVRTSAVRASAPAPAPARRPAPAPVYDEPAPAPVRRATRVTVPAGTSLAATVSNGVSSETAQVGDSVTARVADDVWAGGVLAIPAGSTLRGSVTEAQGLRRIGGKARLAVRFDSLELPSGSDVPVYATWQAEGKGETRRDAATIAGSTVGGAVLGRVIRSRERDRNTAIGAAAGAAVGTVIAARTRGQEVELASGSVIDLTLADSVSVTAG
jgi:hypothetical protein